LAIRPGIAEAQMVQPGPATSSAAAVRDLTEAEVIALALQNNFDVAGAVLAEKQADYAVRSEQGRYAFVLQANAGYTHSATPALSRDKTTPVLVATRDSIAIGSTLNKSFATGTSLSLSVNGERSTANSAVGANITTGAGTGYSLSTRLTATQPLLRGAGTVLGTADLRAAQLSATAQRDARERVTSEVLRDALSAYWELWYASQAVGIEQAARGFAIAQRDDAEARRIKGALASADVLSYDTRIASLAEEVTAAELTELQRSLDLAQLLGVDSTAARYRATGEPQDPAPFTVADVEARLLKQSPELREMQAKLDVAESRAQVAGDAYRPRLDLTGYIELKGLGNGSIPPALGMIGSFSAVGGYVGMQFEAPLDGGRQQAEAEEARVAARIAKNQLDAARNRIRMTAAQLVAQFDAAKSRRVAAEQTAVIAAQQFEAERARFGLGASTPLQVQQAEDTLRQARLRVVRARVDLVQAALSIEHAEGELMSRRAPLAAKQAP
jgi:outer membrane protein TolC